MIKYLLAALVIVAAFVAVFILLSGKKSILPSSVNQPGTTVNTNTNSVPSSQSGNSGVASNDTSDQALNQDLTALDKDLSDLNTLDTSYNADLNNL